MILFYESAATDSQSFSPIQKYTKVRGNGPLLPVKWRHSAKKKNSLNLINKSIYRFTRLTCTWADTYRSMSILRQTRCIFIVTFKWWRYQYLLIFFYLLSLNWLNGWWQWVTFHWIGNLQKASFTVYFKFDFCRCTLQFNTDSIRNQTAVDFSQFSRFHWFYVCYFSDLLNWNSIRIVNKVPIYFDIDDDI